MTNKSKKDERYLNPAANPGIWRADDTVYCCAKCETGFSSITRKHHCRRCGDVFCSRCANHFVAKIRFCDGCVEDLFTFLTRKEDAEEMPETTTLNPAALSERDSQALQERCESMERDLATTKQELCKTKDNNNKLIAIIQEQDLKRHKSRRQWCTGFKCLAGTSGVTTIVAVACIVVPSGPVGWFFGAVGVAAKTFGGLSAASAVAATLLRGKGKSDAHTVTDLATPCPDDFMPANFPAEQQQNQERITQIQADMVQVRDLWAEFARLVRVQQPGITAFSQHVQSAQNHADRGLNHVRQAAEEVAEEA